METIDFTVVAKHGQEEKGKWNLTFRGIRTTSNTRIAHFKIPIGPSPMESLLAGLSLVDFDELSRVEITLQ